MLGKPWVLSAPLSNTSPKIFTCPVLLTDRLALNLLSKIFHLKEKKILILQFEETRKSIRKG